MSFEALALSVLIASPRDVAEARDAVERVIRRWNADRAHESRFVLLPLRWELDAVPDFELYTQSAINEQIVDHADIVIGLFDARLGTPTLRSLSGTVEELERSVARGARVHVYFSTMPLPRDLDIDQFMALKDFEEKLRSRVFLGTYSSIPDLESQIRTALERDVGKFSERLIGGDSARQRTAPSAILKATLWFDDESVETDSPSRRRSHIEIRNLGAGIAESVRLEVRARSVGEPPISRSDDLDDAVNILPSDAWTLPVYSTAGTASVWQVSLSWEEGGFAFCDEQIINAGGLRDL